MASAPASASGAPPLPPRAIGTPYLLDLSLTCAPWLVGALGGPWAPRPPVALPLVGPAALWLPCPPFAIARVARTLTTPPAWQLPSPQPACGAIAPAPAPACLPTRPPAAAITLARRTPAGPPAARRTPAVLPPAPAPACLPTRPPAAAITLARRTLAGLLASCLARPLREPSACPSAPARAAPFRCPTLWAGCLTLAAICRFTWGGTLPRISLLGVKGDSRAYPAEESRRNLWMLP